MLRRIAVPEAIDTNSIYVAIIGSQTIPLAISFGYIYPYGYEM
jgi:hypothetical protein